MSGITRFFARLRPLRRFPYLVLWLAPLTLLAPVYLTGRAMFWGTPLLQFVPWYAFAWETLLAGHLPLWNPYVGMGAPLLANYQSALLYPGTWGYFLLYLLGGVRLVAWGQALSVALHLAWPALGMALLVRRLKLSPLAQTVGGLAFGLSGYLVARAGFLSINTAAAWLPWVILSLTILLERLPSAAGAPPALVRLRRSAAAAGGAFVALTACVALQLLTGHAQTAWYTLLLAGFWAVFWGLWGKKQASSRLGGTFWGLCGLAAAVLLAAGIAAAQLLPTAEYLANSPRSSAVGYDYAMNYSFWPWHLLTLAAPGLFGSPVGGDYWAYSAYWEDAVYIGLLPLLLAVSALGSALREAVTVPRRKTGGDRLRQPIELAGEAHEPSPKAQQPAEPPPVEPEKSLPTGRQPAFIAFLFGLLVVSFVFSLGSFTPLYPWLYRHVPTFAMFQAPARWLIWAEFALACLAAAGADGWRRPRHRSLYWTRLGTMGALAITLGAGLGWLLLGEISPTFIRATALMGLWGFGAGILSLAAPEAAGPPVETTDGAVRRWVRRRFPRRSSIAAPLQSEESAPISLGRRVRLPLSSGAWQALTVIWIALDLLVAGWGLNPAGALALYDPAPEAGRIRAMTGSGRFYTPERHEDWLKYVRFLRFNTFKPGEPWGNLRAVNLANANMLDHIYVANQYDPLKPAWYVDWQALLAKATPERREQLLRLMNVTVVQKLSRHAPNGVVYELLETGGPAGMAACALLAESPLQARDLILSGQVDFEREVVLETPAGTPALALPALCEAPVDTQANSVGRQISVWASEANPNRVDLQVTTSAPGWLWLADTWYPGWQARLNGAPTPVYRANVAFRAIYLPAGEHEVRLQYQPVSAATGALISLLSLAIAVSIGRKSVAV